MYFYHEKNIPFISACNSRTTTKQSYRNTFRTLRVAKVGNVRQYKIAKKRWKKRTRKRIKREGNIYFEEKQKLDDIRLFCFFRFFFCYLSMISMSKRKKKYIRAKAHAIIPKLMHSNEIKRQEVKTEEKLTSNKFWILSHDHDNDGSNDYIAASVTTMIPLFQYPFRVFTTIQHTKSTEKKASKLKKKQS